jgi:hypothetical protein
MARVKLRARMRVVLSSVIVIGANVKLIINVWRRALRKVHYSAAGKDPYIRVYGFEVIALCKVERREL